MMLEQEFEQLLAAYFEDELGEAELLSFLQRIEEYPACRRRFQRELRLHSLMREAAQVRVEKEEDLPQVSLDRVSGNRRFGWKLSCIFDEFLSACHCNEIKIEYQRRIGSEA